MFKDEIAAGPCYHLSVYRTGTCRIAGQFAYRHLYRDQDHEYTIYIGIIRGNGVQALVDTGMVSVDEMNRGAGFLMTRLITQEIGEDTLSIVEKAGLKLEEINYIFLTHCHYDHCSMAPVFPNATVVIPKIAWDTWHSRPESTVYLHQGFLSYLEDLHRSGKLLLSTGQVLPGIGTIWVGGHSICSQFVQVNTARGVALLTGDAVQMYRNLNDNDIIHITDDEALSWKAIEIARVEADLLLPGHDPLVHEKYPDDFVA